LSIVRQLLLIMVAGWPRHKPKSA